MSAIKVAELEKTYTFPVPNPARSWVGNFFTPDKKTVSAVRQISFSVSEGETVAFIGPNGAGKSTTIKMLVGILHPTHGDVHVLGLSPQTERIQLARRIGAVFGQRSQLAYNLPLTDTLDLLRHVYDIPVSDYIRERESLVSLFSLGEFLDQPVRKLSLGQRMRAEIAASLIHRPEIIFLDEPSIGLDVVAKRALRNALKEVNRERGTTIFLTSHDAGDIEHVCERTIVINHGALVFDGKTAELKRTYLKKKVVTIHHSGGTEHIEVDAAESSIAAVLKDKLATLDIEDITVEDPPLEEVIGEMYARTRAP